MTEPPRPDTRRDTLLDVDALASLAPQASPPPAAPEDVLAAEVDDLDTLVSRTPHARGTFGHTPLIYVLVHVLDRRFSGTLVVRTDTVTTALLTLREGAVVRVDTPGKGARIGEEAVAVGACTEAQVEGALAVSRGERSLLGAELVLRAGVAPEMVKRLVLLQTAQRVATLVNLPPDTTYALHLGERGDVPHEPWAPLDVLLAAVRAWRERPRIHGTIRFVGAHPLRLHPDADLDALLTLPAERQALDAMSQHEVSLETLYRSIGGGLSSLIYVLAVTRHLISSDDERPPMGRRARVARGVAEPGAPVAQAAIVSPSHRPAESAAPPFTADPGASPAMLIVPLQQPVTESFARADTLPEIIPVAVPRVTAPYPTEPHGTAAPLAPAPRSASNSSPPVHEPTPWPPSGAPPAPAPLSRSTLVSATAAPRVSGPPAPPSSSASPQATVRTSPAPPPVPASTPAKAKVPDAETSPVVDEALVAFNAAEAALARHDLVTAELHAVRATHAAPNRPEYAALFAWVCAQSGDEDAIPQGVRALTRILEDHPKCESALYYRGMLLRRAGKEKSALRDFVMILYENPTHIQALGEVRELRKKKK